jgi:hypothetical protein
MPRLKYTINVLKEGFKRFFDEHGHYPSSNEVDACPYLCTSKQIQRKFGGIYKLRELLDIKDSDYAHGEHRKKIGESINKLAISSELQVAEFLNNKFGVICVHEEKKYGTGRNRVDFFVYAKPNFAVEVFNTYTIRNLAINLNMKLHKFRDFTDILYFVVTGAEFRQSEIDKLILRKNKVYLMPNMKCVTFNKFKEECKSISPLKVEMPTQTKLF